MCANVHVHSHTLCIFNISGTECALRLLVLSIAYAHASTLQKLIVSWEPSPEVPEGHPFEKHCLIKALDGTEDKHLWNNLGTDDSERKSV